LCLLLIILPPHSHRARFIRAKRLALSDPAAVAAVLGIAPSAASSALASAGHSAPLSGADTPAPVPVEDKIELEQLTTSSKSVMDYFKEKLAAKSSAATPRTPDRDSEGDAPRIGLGASRDIPRDMGNASAERPRTGLGGFGAARALAADFFTPTSSVAIMDDQTEVVLEAVDKLLEEVTTSPSVLEVTEKERRNRERKEAKQKRKAKKAGAENQAGPEGQDTELSEEARREAKRRRREEKKKARQVETEVDAAAVEEKEAVEVRDTEVARKEAKRARKEAKRKAKEEATVAGALVNPAEPAGEANKRKRKKGSRE
jgi:Pin2-interacting protein X1